MNIAVVTRTWNSGAAHYAAALTTALAEAGARVEFVAPPLDPQDMEPVGLHRRIVTRRAMGGGSGLAGLVSRSTRVVQGWGAILGFALRSPRPSTVIFTLPDPLPLLIPVLAMLRLMKVRVVYVVHDVLPHEMRGDFTPAASWLFWSRIAFDLCESVVVLSAAAREELISILHQRPNKVSVIQIGALMTLTHAPLPGNGVLLAFGSVRRNKRVLEVIEAVKLCRAEGLRMRLVIAGDADVEAPYYRDCLAAIREDADGFDVLSEYIPDTDLQALFTEADAVVLAYDGFTSQSGVAVLAGQAGRPVVSSFVGGIAELREAGLCGEAIPLPVTVEGVASALRDWRRTPTEVWESRAAEGAARLAEALSWKGVASQFLRLAAAP